MNRNTDNQVILITGSSRGIGAATAIEAAKRGYSIGINYLHDEDRANSVAEEVAKFGVPYLIFQADVSQEKQVKSLFEKVTQVLGSITALVNNVGIIDQKMKLADMSMLRVERILKANVLSTFACCKEAIKHMAISLGHHGGSIVNVSSIAAKLGSANEYIDYAASKGAIDTLTIGLAKEVVSENIRVNCVRPGLIYTDIHKDGGEENRVQRLAPAIPLQRGGEPKEVANAILWLLSNEASYVTGSFIDVAGGL